MFKNEIFNDFENKLDKFTDEQKERVQNIVNKMNSISVGFENGGILLTNNAYKNQLTSSLNRVYANFSTLLVNKSPLQITRLENEFNSFLNSLKSYTMMIPNYDSSYSEFKNYIKDTDKKLNDDKEEYNKIKLMYQEDINVLKSMIDKLNKDINFRKEKFDKLSNSLSNVLTRESQDLLTGSYSKKYKAEDNASKAMLIIASSLTITAIILTISAFSYQWFGDSWDTGSYLARMVFAITLAPLSAYLYKQSSNHRHFANYYSQMETELSTVQGYIQGLKDDEKSKIELLLAMKFFGNANSKISTNEDGIKPGLLEIVKMIYPPTSGITIPKE